LAADKGTN